MDQQYPDLKLQLRCDMLVGGRLVWWDRPFSVSVLFL